MGNHTPKSTQHELSLLPGCILREHLGGGGARATGVVGAAGTPDTQAKNHCGSPAGTGFCPETGYTPAGLALVSLVLTECMGKLSPSERRKDRSGSQRVQPDGARGAGLSRPSPWPYPLAPQLFWGLPQGLAWGWALTGEGWGEFCCLGCVHCCGRGEAALRHLSAGEEQGPEAWDRC